MSRIVVVGPCDEGTAALVTSGAAQQVATIGEAVEEIRGGDVAAVLLPRQLPGVGCCHTAAHVLAGECAAAALNCPTVATAAVELLSVADAAITPAPAEVDDGGPASGIDWPTLSALEEDLGDAEFVAETVTIFLDELPGRTSAVLDGIDRGSPQDFREAAHSLKSSSAMLGALLLAELCAQLEQLAAAGDVAEAPSVAQALIAEAGIVADALRARAG